MWLAFEPLFFAILVIYFFVRVDDPHVPHKGQVCWFLGQVFRLEVIWRAADLV